MFTTMAEVRKANRALGHHWFDGSTMEFFATRIETELYSGRYFITSEQLIIEGSSATYPWRYTVRVAKEDGSIGTVGEFQAHETLKEALEALGMEVGV